MIEGHTLYSNEFVMCHYFIILINLNLVWKVCPTPDLKLTFEFLWLKVQPLNIISESLLAYAWWNILGSSFSIISGINVKSIKPITILDELWCLYNYLSKPWDPSILDTRRVKLLRSTIQIKRYVSWFVFGGQPIINFKLTSQQMGIAA
jgi:hypothetical protein